MMKSARSGLSLLLTLLLISSSVFSQGRRGADRHAGDTARFRSDYAHLQNDTAHFRGDTSRFRNDSNSRRRNMASLFADSTTLSTSDYQLQIEKTYVILHNIETNSELGFGIDRIRQRLADSDSILAVIKDNINNNSEALNLRNLQVFRTLLENIADESRQHHEMLDSSEARLNNLKGDMKLLIGDTVMRQLFRDSILRAQFAPQMKDMRGVWRSSTQQLKKSLAEINYLQTQNSSSAISTAQLLEKLTSLLNSSASRLFGKEFNYLWETKRDTLSKDSRSSFRKAYDGERKALRYYFRGSGIKRMFLLLIGLLFFLPGSSKISAS